MKTIVESQSDSESVYYVKDERTKQFAYSFHATSNRIGIVLGIILTPGKIHNSQMLEPLVIEVIEKVGKPTGVAVDVGYNNRMTPALPYTRQRTKESFF